MKIHLTVKFRAFGFTFGTVEQSFPIADILSAILANVKGDTGGILAGILGGQADSIKPHVWYDNHGVKLELTA